MYICANYYYSRKRVIINMDTVELVEEMEDMDVPGKMKTRLTYSRKDNIFIEVSDPIWNIAAQVEKGSMSLVKNWKKG